MENMDEKPLIEKNVEKKTLFSKFVSFFSDKTVDTFPEKKSLLFRILKEKKKIEMECGALRIILDLEANGCFLENGKKLTKNLFVAMGSSNKEVVFYGLDMKNEEYKLFISRDKAFIIIEGYQVELNVHW